MLLGFLLVLLIIVILFRDEIKNLIAYGILAILAFALWDTAWWGKTIIIILGALLIFSLVIHFFELLKGKRFE